MKFRRGEYYLSGSASRELMTVSRTKARVVPGMLSQDESNDGIEITMKKICRTHPKARMGSHFLYLA